MNSLVDFINSPGVELFAKVCGIVGSMWACGVVVAKIVGWLKGQTLRRLGTYVAASIGCLGVTLFFFWPDLSGSRPHPAPSPLGGETRGTPATDRPAELPPTFRNSLGQELVRIAAGTFTMGSPSSEEGRGKQEGPQHEVTIGRPFYLSIFEVTQAEYEQVMGANPSLFARSGGGASRVRDSDTRRRPVENVSHVDACAFCQKLSDRSEERQPRRKYRLPTEAEWEYACRAGSTSAFATGAELSSLQANCDGRLSYGVAGPGPYLERPAAVGGYSPNAWGLFDMHGNVAEWCADPFAKYPRPRQAPDDGHRVVRGGSWSDVAAACRSAARDVRAVDWRSPYIGFRVACEVE